MWSRVTDLIRNDFDVEVVDNYKYVSKHQRLLTNQ